MLQFLSPIKWVGKSFAYREVGFVVFVTFLSHFWNYWWPLLAFDDLWRAFLETKMWQKCNRRKFFVSFLTHFWNGFCHILNTFLLFVSFLSQFRRFLSEFCHIFVFQKLIILSRSAYSLLSHFCQFFVNFCHIYVTFSL